MSSWMRARASFAYDVLEAAARQYGFDRVNRMAAAVSYRGIFAIAPLILIAVSVLGLVVSSDDAQAEILATVERVFGEEIASAFATLLASVVQTGDVTAVIGFVLFLWTSSSLFFEVQNDLNDIFKVPYGQTAGFVAGVRKRGIGFLWALGLGLLSLAVWLLNVTWGWFEALFPPELAGLHTLLGWLTPLLSLLVFPVVFGLLFQTLTDVKVEWRAVRLGAVFTSVVFVLTSLGTGLYFSWDAGTSASQIAGALFVLLLLAYVLSSVFLYGAVVTKVYADYLEHGDVLSPTRRLEMARAAGIVVSDAPDAVPMTAIFAFLGGLFLGSRRNRR